MTLKLKQPGRFLDLVLTAATIEQCQRMNLSPSLDLLREIRILFMILKPNSILDQELTIART